MDGAECVSSVAEAGPETFSHPSIPKLNLASTALVETPPLNHHAPLANNPEKGPFEPTPPAHGKAIASESPRPRTAREMKEARKKEFAATAYAIAFKNDAPPNIHREALPSYVPKHIQDNVEMCYLKLEQPGWVPLENVDPEGSKEHPSFKMWYEYPHYEYNAEGVGKFKDSPRLHNYRRQKKQMMNPYRPDSTRALGESRYWKKKVEKVRGGIRPVGCARSIPFLFSPSIQFLCGRQS